MYKIKEYRQNPDRLSDLLPWAAIIAPGVVLNKDGSFQKTLIFRGPDLDSSTEEELVVVSARINNVLKRFGSSWAIFGEAQRFISDNYPESHFPNQVCRAIDEERKRLFVQTAHLESRYYFTLVYLPPTDNSGKLAAIFVENTAKEAVNYKAHLKHFEAEVNRVTDLLAGILPEIRPLNDEETLSYLHTTISIKRHKIKVPTTPIYIDSILADTPLIGGLEPRLGKIHLRTVSVVAFPDSSVPGILDGLNHLAIEYRWSTRFIPLDKTEAHAEVSKYKKRWFAKRKNIVTMAKELLFGGESIMTDSDAEMKAGDADIALQEIAADIVSYGYFTATVVVWDEDTKKLEDKVRAVEKTINGLGFTTITETINAVDAWLGTVPGHCRANIRRPLLNTLNLTHLLPISAVWAGPETHKHFKAPVLLHAITTGSTPYRLVMHVGDVGHSMIVGPTGAGKDVLMATIEAQFLRYPDAQVYIFDKGGSSRALTAGVGGDFYDLGTEKSLSFQPYAHIDDEIERSWATDWTLDILRQENIEITPQIKNGVWETLTSLASAPPAQRTISGFVALSQDFDVRQAMVTYTISGVYGHIFDSQEDNLSISKWQAFEMEKLMNTPAAVAPAISYLFHRLETRFTGDPTILILNEAWIFFDHPAFAAKIREWLKVVRKLNVSVHFATQGLTDIINSTIAAALIESCPTRIFLPNDRALNEDSKAVYKRFGLNDTQIRIIATATPKRQYYYQSSMGNRLFELGLGPFALAYCAVSDPKEQQVIKQILANHEKTSFNDHWQKYKQITN